MPIYLLAVFASWFVAQGAKYLVAAVKERSLKKVLGQLYMSGNMPSAHSAVVATLSTLIGLKDGFDSAIFAVAFTFSVIVMYDAVMVRRSSGEQGEAIKQIIKFEKYSITPPRAAKGHNPVEVLVGAIVGVIVATVVFLATK